MSNTRTVLIALTALVSISTLASAQVAVPINNWSYQRHASTATEGYLRGSAAVIQSAGQKNYLDSVAAVNYQEALRRSIENSGLRVKTYFENKELNRAYREKYAAVPPTKEQWERITLASLPDRLTPEQFDSSTGKLVWPHILRADEYAAFRDRIDTLMASRTPGNSGDGSPAQRQLDPLIDAMKRVLKSNIDNVSFSQYAAAKWFLRSLDYEAQLPLNSLIAQPVASKPTFDSSASVDAAATDSVDPPADDSASADDSATADDAAPGDPANVVTPAADAN
ncbi:MAG: hypothetical protein AAF483_24875 [Planctomycetota bacterium]